MTSPVEAFLQRAPRWQAEMRRLRAIALGCGLHESLKWGKPCYTVPQGNVAIIQPFKERCAFMFFKGALLADPHGLLEAPGPHSHQARRCVFASVADIDRAEPQLRTFIAEAVGIEAAGLKVPVADKPLARLVEMDAAFAQVEGLKKAFDALTPGRQRAYVLHVASAKQAVTRALRMAACVPRVLAGKGLNDA